MGQSEVSAGKFVKTGDVTIHYHEVGTGPAVILIHGGGPGASGLSNYSRNIGALGQRFRAIALDLPCYGKSTKLHIDGDITAFYADCLKGFMDELGLEQADFVGNSLGGRTSLQMALRHTSRVRKLVLMGSGGGYPVFTPQPTEGTKALSSFYDNPSMESLKRFIDYLVFDPSTVPQELLQERLAQALDPDTMRHFPIKRSNRGSALTIDIWRERLDRLPQETLIIWGREDLTNTPDNAFILSKQIPNARLFIMPKCGHWVQWEKADEFNRLVLDFLAH